MDSKASPTRIIPTQVSFHLNGEDRQLHPFISLPYNLTNSLPSSQRIVHRLVYYASAQSSVGNSNVALELPTIPFMILEAVLAEPNSSLSPVPGSSESTEPQLMQGLQRQVDIMLPDR